MTKRQARAISALFAARESYDGLVAKYAHTPKPRGGTVDREITAAYNALSDAQFPFSMGEYAWPENYGTGI